MGNTGVLTACPVSCACAVLSCALTPLCWIAPLLLGSSAMGADNLGSSCILALPSVNNLQDDCVSAIKSCPCFLLARGVFGKQGYQCQGKVLCSCMVCVGGMCCFWEHSPMLLGHPAALSCSGVTTPLPLQAATPLLLSPCQVWVGSRAATDIPANTCMSCLFFHPVQFHSVAGYVQHPAKA